MFDRSKAQKLPSDRDIMSRNMSLEALEAHDDQLFDEIREGSEAEEVDLSSTMETLHYERSTLQFIKNYIQENNKAPQDVVQLMCQQDSSVADVFPNLVGSLQTNESVDVEAITQEIDFALEGIKNATYKTVNASVKSSKLALKKNVKVAASLAATVAVVSGLVYSIRKINEFVSRNKIPTYDELSTVLETVNSSTDDVISFGRDVIDNKLYERKDDIFTRADEFINKYGDILNISIDKTGRKVSHKSVYSTVRSTTLEEAGYDAKALSNMSEKVKTINISMEKKNSQISALLDEFDSICENAVNDSNLTDSETSAICENIYIASELVDVFIYQSRSALKDAEMYIKRIDKLVKEDGQQSS